MGRIQTGVDKLVSLLHARKKVSVEDAAKELGVSRAIVQEWADFLAEEGLLDLKFSLSKTTLVERQLSKREVEVKEKQFHNQRETFIRRVDTTIAQLERETASFEKFRKEFIDLKDELGKDIARMEKEFAQLKEYGELRKEVTEDLAKQRAAFVRKQQETEAAIKRQYTQYEQAIHAMSEQEKRLSAQKKRVHDLISSEEQVAEKLLQYSKLLDGLKKQISSESDELGLDEATLDKLRKEATRLQRELHDIEKDELRPLEEQRVQVEERSKRVEARLLEKAAQIDKSIDDPVKVRTEVKRKIEEFLSRKAQIEEMLHAIEHDKHDLVAELRELQQRADAYSIGKTQVRLEELEEKLKTIETRKKGLSGHIAQFLKLLR